jgi:peptide-methionine (S)-S-oxide reductase
MKPVTLLLFLSVFNLSCMSQTNDSTQSQTATFGAGCFWCIETIFTELKGVHSASSGYEGGSTDNPAYKDICTGTTGHAEVIKIKYDSTVISYKQLLEVFWQIHDPTTLNRQGNDIGTQYRSVVFYHNDYQKKTAEFYKVELEKAKVYNDPIVTEISPASTFYIAENYHQDYYSNNQQQPYCRLVITPKVEKFRKVFKSSLK